MSGQELWPAGGTADIAAALQQKGVRYLVIGGVAVKRYCPARRPSDLDILVDPLAVASIREVLSRWGISFPDPKPNRAWHIGVHTEILFLDLLSPQPKQDFEAMWERREVGTVGGFEIPVVSLHDLIEIKRLTLQEPGSHEQDRADLEALELSRGANQPGC